MDRSNWPLLLIEGVLVFGGAIGFAWWQLRDVERAQRAAAERRQTAREASAEAPADAAASSGAAPLSQNIDR